MAEHEQDQCIVTEAVTALGAGGFSEVFDFLVGEVFSGATFAVWLAARGVG